MRKQILVAHSILDNSDGWYFEHFNWKIRKNKGHYLIEFNGKKRCFTLKLMILNQFNSTVILSFFKREFDIENVSDLPTSLTDLRSWPSNVLDCS